MAKPQTSTPDQFTEICDRLDTVIALLIPRIDENDNAPKGLANEILKLCDYEHSSEDIQKTLGKTMTHISKELSVLRAKGMVRTVQRSGRSVHIRL